MARTISKFDLNLVLALKSIWQSGTQKYDGGLNMIRSEDSLTIPLHKPEISANKQLASASLPCWVAFDYYCCLVSCCFCVVLENLEDCCVKAL